MIAALLAMIARDVRRAWRGGMIGMPVIFYLAVATLYPFAVGPDPLLLQRTGGGVLWIAALLATLLPLDQLVRPDVENGVYDQLTLRGLSEEAIALARIASHWMGFAPPLLLASVPGAALMGLEPVMWSKLALGLLLASPALAALAVMIAALTASLRGSAALGGLLLVPLAIPLLIFGAGSMSDASGSGLLWLAAAALVLLAIAPFAIGAALRAGRE